MSPREEGRLSFSRLLQAIYDREGRIISVLALGDKLQTLELTSALMMEGNYTLEAARRETVDCSDCMLMINKLAFKTVVLSF